MALVCVCIYLHTLVYTRNPTCPTKSNYLELRTKVWECKPSICYYKEDNQNTEMLWRKKHFPSEISWTHLQSVSYWIFFNALRFTRILMSTSFEKHRCGETSASSEWLTAWNLPVGQTTKTLANYMKIFLADEKCHRMPVLRVPQFYSACYHFMSYSLFWRRTCHLKLALEQVHRVRVHLFICQAIG